MFVSASTFLNSFFDNSSVHCIVGIKCIVMVQGLDFRCVTLTTVLHI